MTMSWSWKRELGRGRKSKDQFRALLGAVENDVLGAALLRSYNVAPLPLSFLSTGTVLDFEQMFLFPSPSFGSHCSLLLSDTASIFFHHSLEALAFHQLSTARPRWR